MTDARRAAGHWAMALAILLTGCGGGTIASVHLPTLPDPGPSRFESFDDWDARVNPTTREGMQKSE